MQADPAFETYIYTCLSRYILCDWGDTCEDDKKLNDNAVKYGERILAEYQNNEHTNWRIWIITEWDRSATTILFPEEY